MEIESDNLILIYDEQKHKINIQGYLIYLYQLKSILQEFLFYIKEKPFEDIHKRLRWVEVEKPLGIYLDGLDIKGSLLLNDTLAEDFHIENSLIEQISISSILERLLISNSQINNISGKPKIDNFIIDMSSKIKFFDMDISYIVNLQIYDSILEFFTLEEHINNSEILGGFRDAENSTNNNIISVKKEIKTRYILFSQVQIINTFYIKEFKLLMEINLKQIIFQKDSKLFLKNMNIETFIIDDITQDWSEAIFENITVMGKLKLENIDLQKAKFVDCDFSECEIEIANSVSFKDSLFNSVNWGDISNIKAERDIFRQLKYVNEAQGNVIQANRFYAEEMNRYEKEQKSFSDEVIFKLNKYISNFGQNYFLPLFWIFIITGLMVSSIKYQSLLQNISEILALEFGFIISLFINEFSKYWSYIFFLFVSTFLMVFHFDYQVFVFLTEIAKFSMLKLNSDYESNVFLWFIHKTILSILIYHLTIAFRRQTKR